MSNIIKSNEIVYVLWCGIGSDWSVHKDEIIGFSYRNGQHVYETYLLAEGILGQNLFLTQEEAYKELGRRQSNENN